MAAMKFLKTLFNQYPRSYTDPSRTISTPTTIRKMSQQTNPTFYDPKPQPFYAFEHDTWQKSTSKKATYSNLPAIKLISWNIDFQAPASQARMIRALGHLHQLIQALPPSTHPIILLQEMTASDLSIIQSTLWIQQSFHITDNSHVNWLSHYGTLTLLDRRLYINSVFRIRYASDMGRDALFVDIEDASSTTLRICNTHLESLCSDPPLRPAQVKLATRYLRDPTVDGAVIAGAFNAIQDFDKVLHEENGLKDAYLEWGGTEDEEEGWTWGMQCFHKTTFPCLRMDKILYCGRLSVQKFERIGAGVRVEGLGNGLYVTDHLGLMADLVIEDP